MNNYIKIKSLTLAIKGRTILQNQGFETKMEKVPSESGCIYAINIISGDISVAYSLLAASGIDVL